MGNDLEDAEKYRLQRAREFVIALECWVSDLMKMRRPAFIPVIKNGNEVFLTWEEYLIEMKNKST